MVANLIINCASHKHFLNKQKIPWGLSSIDFWTFFASTFKGGFVLLLLRVHKNHHHFCAQVQLSETLSLPEAEFMLSISAPYSLSQADNLEKHTKNPPQNLQVPMSKWRWIKERLKKQCPIGENKLYLNRLLKKVNFLCVWGGGWQDQAQAPRMKFHNNGYLFKWPFLCTR